MNDKLSLLCSFFLLALLFPASGLMQRSSADLIGASACPTVILSSRDDPYYPLAEQIADNEGLPLVYSLNEALDCHPGTLLWVASPDSLSDQAMVAYGTALKERGVWLSSGIITGSSLENARALYQRGRHASVGSAYAVNAANPAAHIEQGQIVRYEAHNAARREPLTKSGLLQALAEGAYLSFTGHGGGSYWRLESQPGSTLRAADLPALNRIALSTGSCQTLRPWVEGSIALAFADQGASAYAGFVYSPNEGYLIGEFQGLPLRYTWPGFPIGAVVAVQNRGAMQGFASFPYYHLLGDPRSALGDEPAYNLVSDESEGDTRTLHFTEAPVNGLLPVLIQGGARYSFVEVVGEISARQHEPFYNSRLQMVDIGDDKYVLLLNPGGEFSLRLHARAPFLWAFSDLLLDSLDDSLLFRLQAGTQGDLITFGAGVAALLLTALVARRRGATSREWIAAILCGAGLAGLYGLYALMRLERATITSKTLVFSAWALLGIGLLSASGALLYLRARGWPGKAAALLVASLPFWFSGLFSLGGLALVNQLMVRPAIGTSLWNANMAWTAWISFGILTLLLWSVFAAARGLIRKEA